MFACLFLFAVLYFTEKEEDEFVYYKRQKIEVDGKSKKERKKERR